MCPRCAGFTDAVRLRLPHEYIELVSQLRQVIAEGTLAIESGDCPLEEIRSGATWPGDALEHRFRCTSCGQRFRLTAETYHGSGGRWDLV